MSRFSLNLPQQLKQEAEQWAAKQGISLNQFILWAVAELLRREIGICLPNSLLSRDGFPIPEQFQARRFGTKKGGKSKSLPYEGGDLEGVIVAALLPRFAEIWKLFHARS